jgi:hypothetical protein
MNEAGNYLQKTAVGGSFANKDAVRVQQYNTEAAAGVQPFNMLRPIPQSQIDLVTEGPAYPQNPGYF